MSDSSRPTIYVVAERAGVSISTVSLALNRPERVGAATRQRVLAVVDELGYRSGTSRRTRTIAVAAPFASSPSYYRRLDGILEATREPRIDVIVHNLPAANEASDPILDVLPIRQDIDGIIIMGIPLSAEVEATIIRTGLPAVVVDVPGSDLPSVIGADRRGGELIGAHLNERGHEHVLFVHEARTSAGYIAAGQLRLEGLRLKLPRVTRLPISERIHEQLGDATAIAANNDRIAAQILPLLRQHGLRVPEDIALTGYDDGDLAAALDLTTIAQTFSASGRMAANVLVSIMTGSSVGLRNATIDVELIVRGSSGGA